MSRMAVVLAVVLGCSGGATEAPAPVVGGPTTGGGGAAASVDAGLVARFDAAVKRGLVMLDAAEQGVTPGKRLDPKVRVRLPLTRDPKAPAPAVSVTYFHELACKHCAALRQMIAALPARDPEHVVLVQRVILVHRAPSLAAHLVECAAHRLGHDVTDALWAGAFDARDYTSANLIGIATAAGVDGEALVKTAEADDCLAEILADHVLALRAGVRGTPTFFVNGIPIEGLPDDQLLFDVIAAETRAAAAAPTVADYHAGWQATARAP